MENKIKKIRIGGEDLYYSLAEVEETAKWYKYCEWRLSKYGFSHEGRVREEHSFENWKVNGCPQAGL